MTNIVIATVCTSLITNWVTVENKQVGVLVEVRSVDIEGRNIELSRTIIDQKLMRDPVLEYSKTNVNFRWWEFQPTNVWFHTNDLRWFYNGQGISNLNSNATYP